MSLPNHLKSQRVFTLTTATFPNHSSTNPNSFLTLLSPRPSVSPWSPNAVASFSTHLILSTTHSCSSLQLGRSLGLPLTSPLVLSPSLSWSSLSNFLIQASFLPTLSSPSAPLVEDSLAWTSHLPSLSIPDLHFHCQLNRSVVSRDSHVPDLPLLLCSFFYFLLNSWYSSFSHLHYKSWKCSQEWRRLWIHLVHSTTFSTSVNTRLIN